MPYTSTGKYYSIKNGKRSYNARYNKRVVTGKGAYRSGTKKKSSTKSYRKNKTVSKAPSAQGSLGRTLLNAGGGIIGGMLGSPAIGAAAGNALASILGMGSYEIKENVFLEGRLPQVVNQPSGGGTIIRFQEYLSDVITGVTPGSFTIQTFSINPGNAQTFPWLSQIANNYEQYEFEGLLFEFRSTSADALNSTNTALGSVMLATQYNVLDAPFASKQEMLNYEYSNSVKPSDCVIHMVECARRQSTITELYTLFGSAPTGSDLRLYNLGTFTIATTGFQAALVNIGELHVTYQVRLLKPKLFASLGWLNGYFTALLSTTGVSSAYTNAQPFGTTAILSLPIVVTPGGATTFNLRASGNSLVVTLQPTSLTIQGSYGIKYYRLELIWQGDTAAVIASGTLGVTNATITSLGTVSPGANSLYATTLIGIKADGSGRDIVFSYSVNPTLPTNVAGLSQFIARVMLVSPTDGAT